MAFKVALLCVSALLVQSIASQQYCGCLSGSGRYGSYGAYGSPSSVSIPSSGGDLPVTSLSSIYPSGISVDSQLDLNGDLDVSGELPFLSAVEFETNLDTSGEACVDYSCGCAGKVGINTIVGGSNSGSKCTRGLLR